MSTFCFIALVSAVLSLSLFTYAIIEHAEREAKMVSDFAKQEEKMIQTLANMAPLFDEVCRGKGFSQGASSAEFQPDTLHWRLECIGDSRQETVLI